MFEGMLKHTGLLNNTGKNVVVVFMQLPEDSDHALVIDTDALPDMFNESLRKVVESTEAQQAKNLADVLARRMSPDGSGTTMLQKFHQSSRLMKTPVTNVTMVPRKGVRWPLTEVIAAMAEPGAVTPGFDELDPETKAAVAAEVKKFNVHANNQEGQTAAGRKADASALLEMAKLLEADAQSKREQAYRIDPSLKPKHKKPDAAVVAAATADVGPVASVGEASLMNSDAASAVEHASKSAATTPKTTSKKTASKKAA